MKRVSYATVAVIGGAACVAAAIVAGSTGLVAQQPARQGQAVPAAAAAAAAPARTETVTYDSWSVTCRDTLDTKSKKVCSATLQVADEKSGQTLLVWIIGHNSEGALLTLMRTPTGVLIQKGVELKLGSGPTRKLGYLSCDARQCEATAPIDDAIAREAAGAKEATITVYATDGRGINFNVPVKGTDKAIAAVGR
jgi:invasion protein IalB